MKLNFYGALGLFLSVISCQSPQGNIEGTLQGVESDTILVSQYFMGATKNTLDTIPLKNGSFSITLPDSAVSFVSIFAKPTGNQALRMSGAQESIVLLPGNKLKVTGTVENLQVTGSEFYKEKNAFTELDPLQQKQKELTSYYQKEVQSGRMNDSLMAVFRSNSEAVYKEKDNLIIAYIKAHPNTELSAYYFATSGYDVVDATKDVLNKELEKGPFKTMIQETLQRYNNENERREAIKMLNPGSPAPDFSLPNEKGEMVSLASLKGKYVVLDFWGMWCGWCLRGIPDMKETYEKYKGKLEIVGIDCRDEKADWEAGIRKYELPWINLYAGKDVTVQNKYAVSAFPTKVVIDPQGNIVKIIVGESPEFYELLKELLK
ncbi:MAG: TlpA disulfide reductase family protein [Bacteroidales bacterium]